MSPIEKLALLFDHTPDSHRACDRDLDSPYETEKWLHNFACYFADHPDQFDEFINIVTGFQST